MKRFTERVERDLGQIADRATPSSTAWAAIQHRIDKQDTTNESTMEVIMLSPNRNEPRNQSRTWMLIAASVAALALIGGLIVATNRDDNVPANQPAVTVPGTLGVDGETAPDPAVAPDPALEQAAETLPAVELPTQGVMNPICTTTEFTPNDDGSITGPQNCVTEAEILPISAEVNGTLTDFSPESPPSLFVSTDEDGSFTAGYTTSDGVVRYSGFAPGVEDFDGETIFILGRRPVGGEQIPAISEWTTEPGDAPLSTTEEGGISAEVTVTCSGTIRQRGDTEQLLDQACTYSGDDARFVPEPEVIRVRIFPADAAATTLAEYPLFVTGDTDAGYVFAGIAEDLTTIRGLSVRPGTGEFEGMLVHDVAYFTTASDGSISGTIRSTVYPAQ
jgi:hypothetical protein